MSRQPVAKLLWTLVSLSERYSSAISKGFPYSLPSTGPRANPGVQIVNSQVTISHSPSGKLPLLSDQACGYIPSRTASPPLAGTKLYCLVTETHRCEQLTSSYHNLTKLFTEYPQSFKISAAMAPSITIALTKANSIRRRLLP